MGNPKLMSNVMASIKIDIPSYSLELLVSEEELNIRRQTPPIKPVRDITGYLKRYVGHVASADKGAVLL